MKKKYYLNVGRGTLHITDNKKCYYAQYPPMDAKFFDTEDEVKKKKKMYVKRCRLCFRNQ